MISKKTVNAIEACVLLAKHGGEHVSTTTVSRHFGLSVSYVESLFKVLKDHGVLSSIKGPGGGYQVNGDVSLITVWDIASAFETTPFNAKPQTNHCLSFEPELEQVIVNMLRSFTLSDFVDLSAGQFDLMGCDLGRFKFKPLPERLLPNAPNSVFELSMFS